MKSKSLLSLLSLVFLGNGCATILQGGPDHIRVNSNPEGARVFLNDDPVGSTPTTVSVNHKDDALIRIQKDGYEKVVIDRGKVLSGWMIGNILLGGVIGGSIDLITHNQGHYPEDPVFVELHPVSASNQPDKSAH